MQGSNLGILPACPALAGGFFTTEPPGKPMMGLVPLLEEISENFFSVCVCLCHVGAKPGGSYLQTSRAVLIKN